MRYLGMPAGMWALFAGSFRKKLCSVLDYSPEAAGEITEKARTKYREIIQKLPEFEKEDRFQMNIVNCAMLAAFVLNMPERPTVEKLTDYYREAMMTAPMREFCRMSGKRKFTPQDLEGMRKTAALRAADRNPYSWNMELYPYADGSGYEARFSSCGICTLMRELGLFELVPAMCRLDYSMSEAGGCEFVREYTLASGGPYCDCGYKKKAGRRDNMKADYKNWMPLGMVLGFGAASVGLGAGTVAAGRLLPKGSGFKKGAVSVLAAGTLGCAAFTAWSAYAREQFSYTGERKLSKQIIEGTASYVNLPEGGVGLDVGCGSGALTIACAKRNPRARMVGVDKWGPEYAAFNRARCEKNAKAEGIENVQFQKGDACKLDFPDESFDAVTSNYVYHNIVGVNKQDLLRETLRVLKKGGTFAIHDLMEKPRYGNMEKFAAELRAEGYEEVRLIPTAKGMFMSTAEGRRMLLFGSTLLVGKK